MSSPGWLCPVSAEPDEDTQQPAASWTTGRGQEEYGKSIGTAQQAMQQSPRATAGERRGEQKAAYFSTAMRGRYVVRCGSTGASGSQFPSFQLPGRGGGGRSGGMKLYIACHFVKPFRHSACSLITHGGTKRFVHIHRESQTCQRSIDVPDMCKLWATLLVSVESVFSRFAQKLLGGDLIGGEAPRAAFRWTSSNLVDLSALMWRQHLDIVLISCLCISGGCRAGLAPK